MESVLSVVVTACTHAHLIPSRFLKKPVSQLNKQHAVDLPNGEPVAPFLKWPGGKRWLAPFIAGIVRPYLRGTYYEPFVGGGAVFFFLQPRRASLSDVNRELIETYTEVRNSPVQLINFIKTVPVSAEAYYRMRASEPDEPFERAARLLYLNRTAFGGIYRLNRLGKFNVPFGRDRTPEPLWRNRLLELAAPTLSRVDLTVCDFEDSINQAEAGDVVYCDPTYTVAHSNNGFCRYNERNFAWRDQERLAGAARRASERGAIVLVSNAMHESIANLYRHAECYQVSRPSTVSRNPSKRGRVGEYLFVLKPVNPDVRNSK